MTLDDLRDCFHGIIPAVIATASRDGTPNVTWLSEVEILDPGHVALSRQFFNKTRANILENPRATLIVHHPITFEAYRLELRYLRSETEGALFESMSLRIEAIASHCGYRGIFKLIAAEVYQVLSIARIEHHLDDGLPLRPALANGEAAGLVSSDRRGELRALQIISDRLCRAADLEQLLDGFLEGLEQAFGVQHAHVLLADETGGRLFTVASRGYGESGVGAEAVVGEGLIGLVAQERRVLRLSALEAGMRYGRAVRDAARRSGPLAREIPLPGLPDARSVLALPLLVEDRLVGVVALESPDPLCFDDWHESFLGVVANQAALGIDRLADHPDEPTSGDERPAPPPAAAEPPAQPRPLAFTYYRSDDCIFVDGEYLVRNVPARILWKLLGAHQRERRAEFQNRELRLDPALGLPPVRDNLESRLILLRKRLEERCPDVRLQATGRGRFALQLARPVSLAEV